MDACLSKANQNTVEDKEKDKENVSPVEEKDNDPPFGPWMLVGNDKKKAHATARRGRSHFRKSRRGRSNQALLNSGQVGPSEAHNVPSCVKEISTMVSLSSPKTQNCCHLTNSQELPGNGSKFSLPTNNNFFEPDLCDSNSKKLWDGSFFDSALPADGEIDGEQLQDLHRRSESGVEPTEITKPLGFCNRARESSPLVQSNKLCGRGDGSGLNDQNAEEYTPKKVGTTGTESKAQARPEISGRSLQSRYSRRRGDSKGIGLRQVLSCARKGNDGSPNRGSGRARRSALFRREVGLACKQLRQGGHSPITTSFSMKIISYNARGAANPKFRQTVRDLKERYQPDLFIVTETRVSRDRAKNIRDSLGFDGMSWVNPVGFSGGIWFLWDTADLVASFVRKSQQEITIQFQNVKTWNREHFGNVFYKKQKLLSRLLGAQKALSDQPSQFLIDLDSFLRKELQLVLRQEESLWAMKSRVSWLTKGDNNATFFHTSTLVRRKKNKIIKLKDDSGNDVVGADCISHIANFFLKLYSSESDYCEINPTKPDFSFNLVDSEFHNSLSVVPSISEIKKALWSMKPFKTPGPDGLHAGFFQHCWEDVHLSLCKDIQEIFATSSMPDSWKRFLIVLVPKINNPESIRLFRPISLGNTCYKIVTKIVASRIKGTLNDLISPFQGTFLEGGRASDNIILAQEVMHTAKTSKAKDGWMVIKIDLEKAFDRKWNPIRIGRNGPKISHLLFADDIILVAKANERNCLAIKNTLEDFCAKSGQKVNLDKSKIWFSPMVEEDKADYLNSVLGFRKVHNLGIYLGQPLLEKKGNKGDYSYLIDKMRSRLAGWKAKKLSLAGRSTLIQSMTSAIVDYPMQVGLLPASIDSEIDKIHMDFLRGDTDETKKIDLVGWNKVARPKNQGGLNLKRAKLRNMALLAKLHWRIRKDPNNFWTKALCSKYNLDTSSNSNASNVAKSLVYSQALFNKGVKKVIQSGSNTSFWYDVWAFNYPLRTLIQGPLNKGEDSMLVRDCFPPAGGWNLDSISLTLPPDFVDTILSIPFSLRDNVSDSFCCKYSSNGNFSLNSAYDLANGFDVVSDFNPFWKKFWKIHCHNRIKFFFWSVAHGKIPCKSMLYNRKISQELCCDLCPDSEETILHILRDCPLASSVWNSLHCIPSHFFLHSNLETWLSCCLFSSLTWKSIPWTTIFFYSCWNLWKARNLRLFSGQFLSMDSIIQSSSFQALEFFHVARPAPKSIVKSWKNIHWEPPDQGWFLLNTDGSSSQDKGGAAALIRDHLGVWIVGCIRRIPLADSLQAELWGLRDGLLLAKSQGISNLLVKVDFECMI
ncbi:reverse transcriptase [Corchorus capsularis]|uniref:Reverse transcriptase n=1 Tax=Corchorus capsularis TaxID=210143 RepID=A0A1R3JI61_COCAP|nr:reverse transcriptase [Corchorus capsularis]